MKLNEWFFSAELGREVRSQTDYNEGLDEVRHVTGTAKYLERDFGYNKPPKDEWIERREIDLEGQRRRADSDVEATREWQKRNQ
jgi:hypothetical protein